MLWLDFSVQWWDNLVRKLDITIWSLKDFKKPMSESMDIVKKSVDKNFDSSGSETSWKWAGLSASTKLARQKRWWYYRNSWGWNKPLVWSWNLRKNYTITTTNNSWKLEYNAEYAMYHQLGTRKMPKRKFVELNESTKAEISRIFQKYISEKLK